MNGLFIASADPLTLCLLGTAFFLTIASQVRFSILAYQIQSALVAGVALLNALAPAGSGWGGVAVGMLPVALGLIIRPLLVRATLPVPPPTHMLLNPRHPESYRWLHAAEQAWLRRPPLARRRERSFFAPLLFIAILGGSYTIAFTVRQDSGAVTLLPSLSGLAVTFTLLLIGLYNMTNKHDIIVQILGLLIMDHGLFLAAVQIAPPDNGATLTLFVISIYFYTALTLVILVLVLPQLRKVAETIELEKIAQDSELKG